MTTEAVVEEASTKQETVDIIEPTYILKPDETEKFYPSQVKKIIHKVLNTEIEKAQIDDQWMDNWMKLDDSNTNPEDNDVNHGNANGNVKQNANAVETLSKTIGDTIKAKCKEEMNIPRYKLIVQVTIGQRKDQGVNITSRCLWDTSNDNHASASFQNEYIFVSVLVFGLYTD